MTVFVIAILLPTLAAFWYLHAFKERDESQITRILFLYELKFP